MVVFQKWIFTDRLSTLGFVAGFRICSTRSPFWRLLLGLAGWITVLFGPSFWTFGLAFLNIGFGFILPLIHILFASGFYPF